MTRLTTAIALVSIASMIIVSHVFAQSFSIDINPKNVTVEAGGRVTFTLTFAPSGGWEETIFLSGGANGFQTGLPPSVNFPYNPIQITTRSATIDSGNVDFTISGTNGSVRSTTTAKIRINKNPKWKVISDAADAKYWNTYLFTDGDGLVNSVMVPSRYDDSAVRFNRYRTGKWSEDFRLTHPSLGELFSGDRINCDDQIEYESGHCFRLVRVDSLTLWFARASAETLTRLRNGFLSKFDASNSSIQAGRHRLFQRRDGQALFVSTPYSTGSSPYRIFFQGFQGTSFYRIYEMETHQDSVAGRFVIDQDNSIWTLISSYAVVRIAQGKVDTLALPPDFSGKRTQLITNSRNKVVAVAITQTEIIAAAYNGIGWDRCSIPAQMQSETPVVADSKGNLYFNKTKEISRWLLFSQVIETYSTTNSPLPVANVSRMVIDANDNVWISSFRYRHDNTDGSHCVFNPDGLVGIPLVSDVAEDNTQNSEVGTLSLFPNPSDETVTLELDGYENGSSLIRVVNLTGEEMLIVRTDAGKRFTFGTESLPSGTYVVTVGRRRVLLRVVH